MKIIVIPIVVGTLGTVPKNLEKRIDKLKMRGKFEVIQTTALLKSAWIHRRVRKICGLILSLRIQ